MAGEGGLDYTLDAKYYQDAVHKMLYSGNLFSIGFVANSVEAGEANTILIDATSIDIHMRLNWQATATMIVKAYGVSSYQIPGDGLSASNNYAGNPKQLFAGIYANPVIEEMVSSDSLWEQLVPGGAANFSQGGSGGPGQRQLIPKGLMCLYELNNIDTKGVSQGFGITCFEVAVSSLDAAG